jgi:hypothetical protein
VTQLDPESVGVLFLVGDLDVDDHEVFPGDRSGLGPFDRFVLEQVALDLVGHLGFHLLGSGAGIDSDDGSLPDPELGVLIARHRDEAHDPGQNQECGQEDDGLPVAQDLI